MMTRMDFKPEVNHICFTHQDNLAMAIAKCQAYQQQLAMLNMCSSTTHIRGQPFSHHGRRSNLLALE